MCLLCLFGSSKTLEYNDAHNNMNDIPGGAGVAGVVDGGRNGHYQSRKAIGSNVVVLPA